MDELSVFCKTLECRFIFSVTQATPVPSFNDTKNSVNLSSVPWQICGRTVLCIYLFKRKFYEKIKRMWKAHFRADDSGFYMIYLSSIMCLLPARRIDPTAIHSQSLSAQCGASSSCGW